MALQIKNTKDLVIGSINCIFYGHPGSGKTKISGSFPKPLIINIERGLNTLAGIDVDYVDINTFGDWARTWAELQKMGTEKYKTIVIDTATELAELLMEDIAGSGLPKIQDWGTLARRFAQMLKLLRNSGFNTVLIFHENRKVVSGEDGVEYEIKMPEIMGQKLDDVIIRYVDLIGYTYKNKPKDAVEPQYFVNFTGSQNLIAKTRYEALGFEPLRIGKDESVFELIDNGIKKTISERTKNEGKTK